MGIFDNAESVVINGHEVQSIIDSNGGVLYERQSGDNYLLTLTSDKDILSYYDHDTCIITASLTNWGEPLEGENVVFSCDDPIETIEVSSPGIYDLGEYFIINCAELPINPRGSSQKIVIGDTDNSLYIWKSQEDKLTILKNNIGWSGFNDDIVIKNGVLKAYQEEYQKYQTLDVSDVDLTKWTLSTKNSVVIPVEKYFYETAVTDSNGVASVSYASQGIGDVSFQAEWGSIVSQPCEVLDCIKYDKGLSGTGNHNDIWSNITNGSVTRYDEYSELAETGTSNALARFEMSYATPFVVEYDYYQVDGDVANASYVLNNSDWSAVTQVPLNVASTGEWNSVKLVVQNGQVLRYLNGSTTSQNPLTFSPSGNTGYMGFWTAGDITKIRFKNFKVYPI